MKKTNLISNEGTLLNLIILSLIAIIILFQLDKALGITLGYADEVGYWGTAAMISGHDWSDLMSGSSYYSFVYGVVLAIFYILPFKPVVLYRLAIMLNVCLLILAYFTSCKCINKLFKNIDANINNIACAVVVLYSSNIFYAQNTNGEILNLLLFWILFYFFLAFLEKKTIMSAINLALAAMLNFSAHMRSLSLILSTIILVLVVSIIEKKIKVLIAHLFTMGIGYKIFDNLKSFFLIYVYQGGVNTKYNDISGQGSKVLNLFSIDGVKYIIKMCFGRLFYLGASSFLLIYVGIFICLLWFFTLCAKNVSANRKGIWLENIFNYQYSLASLFLILSLAFSIGINAVYFQDPAQNLCFVYYGRYTEYIIGPFLIISLICLFEKFDKCKSYFRFIVPFHLLLCISFYFYLLNNNISKNMIHPNIVGIAGILTILGEASAESATFGISFVAAFICSLYIALLYFLGKKKQRVRACLAVSLLIAFCWVCNTYSYLDNSLNSDAEINYQEQFLEVAAELTDVEEGENVVFLYEGTGSRDMIYLQFQIPDLNIEIINALDNDFEKEILNANYLLLSYSVSHSADLEELLVSYFEKVFTTDNISIYKRKDSDE